MMSASARKSDTSCQRVTSRSTTRRASSGTVWRGGGIAIAQPASSPTTRTTSALLRGLRALTLGTPQPRAGLVQLLLDAVGGGIELQRLLPGGGGVLLETVLVIGVAEVLVDDRVFLGLADRALELAQRVGVLALLVVRPAQAVDEVAVIGLQRQRLADELDGLVEVLPLLGVHVADVVVGLGVLGVERDDLLELTHGGVELGLLLEDDAQLEVQVLLLVVEAQ